ncbi:cupin domain-containing protein [Halostella sp. JP-L12]|uniref:cupin domain-containing protein n=1 Tax=Halostella TaxID=1843185 RepID=UPI000EF8418E|nr:MULTISPECIES: cupin domain-containing protein [Halostella]NHN46071.1 cupin domain-containing protein [Halostella sp. JP-L12]
MKRQSLDEMESRMGPADVIRPLTDALGMADMALNYYELAPGESFAYGYHAHDQQEEVFYVQEGTVTFTTAEGDVEVGPGELVRFGPGEYQRGVNRVSDGDSESDGGDERVVALAMGAPQEAGDTEIIRECGACGEPTPQRVEMSDDRDAVVTRCEECDAETGRFD